MAGARPARVRRATSGGPDAEALSLVGSATFLETFANLHSATDILAHCRRNHSPEAYSCWLAHPRAAAWLLEAQPGEAPVGYAVLAPADVPVPDPRPDDLEVKRIYLLQPFQGAGWGQRLMDEAVAHARTLGSRRVLLGVWTVNEDALRFYARYGFTLAGARQFWIGDTECSDHLLALSL
jgi:ribosomal protein S18 acetylase RimI-like enzyme